MVSVCVCLKKTYDRWVEQVLVLQVFVFLQAMNLQRLFAYSPICSHSLLQKRALENALILMSSLIMEEEPVVNEYCPEWMIPSSLKAVTDTVAALPVADESLEAVADSAVVDEVVEIEEAEPNEEEENAQYLEQDRQMLLDGYTPAYAQQVPVRETVTIINGSRLTMVSLRAFGHKDFWVYIYDANRDQLSSPGAVKPGMTLRIPDMDPLIVDPNNEECLHKAQELARKY